MVSDIVFVHLRATCLIHELSPDHCVAKKFAAIIAASLDSVHKAFTSRGVNHMAVLSSESIHSDFSDFHNGF